MIDLPSPAYFLADCHLPLVRAPHRRRWHERVVAFLRGEAARGRSLVLAGDLFDFWFEWRRSVPAGGFQVLAALHELVRGGRRVLFIAGNHDGHPGGYLRDEVGLEVHRAPVDAVVDGLRVHVIHGDGVAAMDRGYRLLRSLVRWKPTEAIYRFIHPDFGIWFASRVSGASQQYLSKNDRFGPEPYREYAMQKLDAGFNYVVMGHRHASEFVAHERGGFMAIGDWIGSGSYGVIENGRGRLEYYPALSGDSSD